MFTCSKINKNCSVGAYLGSKRWANQKAQESRPPSRELAATNAAPVLGVAVSDACSGTAKISW